MAQYKSKMLIKYMHYISYSLFLVGLFTSSLMFSQTSPPPTEKNAEFVSPLDIPLVLSANYGEYRSGHFHAGIDFKTQQVEGKNVFAVDSGFVYRIVVLTGSYGNALYVKHPSGKISVYGHLNKFEPAIAKYVKTQQYLKKSFTVDLSPAPDLFVYSKGAFLGLSGNSGSSFGAHLHFEVRDASGAIPLNPLRFGFDIKDKVKPEIRWLMIYSLDSGSMVNGIPRSLQFKVRNNGTHLYVNPDTIAINGESGIGIETYDYLDNATNECGPSTIEVFFDDKPFFFCHFDSIPFSAGSYIYTHYDYAELIRTGKKIQKLFIEPNNKLNIYKLAINRGIVNIDDHKAHKVQIRVTDTYGNESLLEFYLKTGKNISRQPADVPQKAVARFFYDSLNVFENQQVRIVVPKNALFNHIDFQYAQAANDSFPYADIISVHNRYTPMLTPYILSIRPKNLDGKLQGKAFIAVRGSDGKFYYQGGEYKQGFITTRLRFFGDFIVDIDTVPPIIVPVQFSAGGRYAEDQLISFRIADSISGIRKFTGYIDGKWALFEYDAKNERLTYAIDGKRLVKNTMHTLELIITDNKDNISRFKSSFYF
jgi:hypothetical protein